ncbi:MAG: bifunctional UDP-N-acetylglucosamine diphosphorylase/glucosamine-1-phosphate N-acetyltransferase GlmU [Proteobacteria bacterium]|nr:bifunctional UDP-N-acetylglucosamine diphosphorylase/glucosamine-1-phosphate N-acetyltransferase GlmU [Pseudomonadota bacterium]
MGLHIIILAAGKGQRMVSETPKVLHPIGGKTLLERVVLTAQKLQPQAIHIVYGNGGHIVSQALSHLPVNWVEQPQLLGTGHAVMQALPFCPDHERVLILYGDVPLISVDTLKMLLENTPSDQLGLIVAEMANPHGFGRIIRNDLGQIVAIVEQRDADLQQRQIREINTGIMTATSQALKRWLPQVKNHNQQQEYYLTDIISLAVSQGCQVFGSKPGSNEEVRGINDRLELAALERIYQYQAAMALMQQGVTVADPNRLDIRGEVQADSDIFIDINVILEGQVKIGKNSIIGPNVILKDVELGENVTVLANSLIEGAVIANDCQIGPFARIRPETYLASGVKIGNFVEVKKSKIGVDTKAQHLSYLGDAMIGSGVNIGAGTITCNYDGVNKNTTHINNGAFIGSNTSLVAPVSIGENATIGAGSTITRDAPANELTVARARQTAIKGWSRTKKKAQS